MNNGKYDKMISVIDMEMPNRKPNRIAGYDYSQSGAYFITICTKDRKNIFWEKQQPDFVGEDSILPARQRTVIAIWKNCR